MRLRGKSNADRINEWDADKTGWDIRRNQNGRYAVDKMDNGAWVFYGQFSSYREALAFVKQKMSYEKARKPELKSWERNVTLDNRRNAFETVSEAEARRKSEREDRIRSHAVKKGVVETQAAIDAFQKYGDKCPDALCLHLKFEKGQPPLKYMFFAFMLITNVCTLPELEKAFAKSRYSFPTSTGYIKVRFLPAIGEMMIAADNYADKVKLEKISEAIPYSEERKTGKEWDRWLAVQKYLNELAKRAKKE